MLNPNIKPAMWQSGRMFDWNGYVNTDRSMAVRDEAEAAKRSREGGMRSTLPWSGGAEDAVASSRMRGPDSSHCVIFGSSFRVMS